MLTLLQNYYLIGLPLLPVTMLYASITKGRVWDGMLAGIVLGPLGIVVVAMLPDVRGTDKRNRIV